MGRGGGRVKRRVRRRGTSDKESTGGKAGGIKLPTGRGPKKRPGGRAC